MIYLKLAVIFLLSYLIGSLSFAIIISKVFYKKDIRNFGSGNAGMTNVLRTFGKKAAAATIGGDFLKGTVSVLLSKFIMSEVWYVPVSRRTADFFRDAAMYIAVGGALLGHLKPLYFGFKGGKGISVAFGGMMAATPVTTSIAFGIWLVVMAVSRIVSLASILSVIGYFAVTMASFVLTKTFSVPNFIAAVIFPSVIIYAHRSNIKRLINGTEYKFGQKK